MCGIAALSLPGPDSSGGAVLERMLMHQKHRGPDHMGQWSNATGDTLIGHNRLSIVDLSDAGHQPLFNETRTICAVVNGEIYNYPELRRDLEGRGHRFSSRSDSEVVVHLYEEFGCDFVDKLAGMFAFVLYDAKDNLMLCARDRLGKKPLVYAQGAYGVALASELPAVAECPGFDRRLDETALALFLMRNFRHVPDPYTIYRGARRLPPGHAMTVRAGRVAKVWRYWHPDFETRPVTPDEVGALFDAAVRKRLMADVEITAMLSGGVDSSAIVQAMHAQGCPPVATYALGRDPDDSELVRARKVAALLGSRHQEFYFDPARHHEMMIELWRIHGEPIALLPLVFAYDLCQRIRADGKKVVMTGHGADETFFGYSGFIRLAQLSRLMELAPSAVTRFAGEVGAKVLPFGHELAEAALVASAPPGRRKAALYAAEAETQLPSLLNLSGAPNLRHAVEGLFDTWMSRPPAAYIDEAAAIGLMHENAHSVTIAGDLPVMAASVEARCPFLDHELVQLAWRTSYKSKVGVTGNTTNLKAILKSALADRLPHDVLYAPKQGFGFNLQESDILTGAWKPQVDAALDQMSDLGGLLSADGIAQARASLAQKRDSHSAMIVSKLYSIAATVQ